MELDRLEDFAMTWLVASLDTYQLGSMTVSEVANGLGFRVDIHATELGLEEVFQL